MNNFLLKHKLRKKLRELRKSAAYRAASDCDLLAADDLAHLKKILHDLPEIRKADVRTQQDFLEKEGAFTASLHPYSGFLATLHGILDVAAVAFAVAFGIRALYIQPFKIPTGSMQPTLFGVHFVDRAALEKNGNFLTKATLPLISRRAYLKVERSGTLERAFEETSDTWMNVSSRFRIGGITYTLPGTFYTQVLRYVNLNRSWFEKDEVLCDGWLVTGDHVFTERFLIHFRGIHRGDVAVFNTENIHSPTQPIGGYYYVKRIAGLPGDTLKITPDNILMIRPAGEQEFRPASEFHPGFRKTDSMLGGYHGHMPDGLLAGGRELTVPAGHYFALGDNTTNSLDGRNWGFIPRRNMIGLAFGVFWPFSRRWGIVDTREPIQEPTELPYSMQIQ